MLNFLSTVILDNISPSKLNWIGKIISVICDKPAYGIGVGVILFTLILKLITLPFDVMSKVSTKKNAIKMEKMRPELEKLQKQYANDKQLYQQKVMALQKKEGYSPFSSCLPSILSIIIFFVVIGAFNDYSTYANRRFANEMINAYNTKIYSLEILDSENNLDISKLTEFNNDSNNLVLGHDGQPIKGYNDYLAENYVNKYNDATTGDTTLYKDFSDAGLRYTILNGSTLTKIVDDYFKQTPIKEEEKVVGYTYEVIDSIEDGKTATEIKDILVNYYIQNYVPLNYYNQVLIIEPQMAAKDAYYKEKDGFLWIKNIWVADSTFKHPLEGASAYAMEGEQYNILTAKMGAEKASKNGYFILVVLSIAVMFLSQLIMEKEQKSQMELQTVEGANSTAGQTQKMMKWIMPIMFGVFAFIYTASFSIYMIISSAFSIVSSLLINLIVKKVFEKKAIQEELQKDKRIKIKK